MKRTVAIASALVLATSSQAKDFTVHVDARVAPWSRAANPKLPFGIGDGRPPVMVWGAVLIESTKVTFQASGRTTTAVGSGSFGPEGEDDWTEDRGGALFPSHYMDVTRRPVHLNELVGAFVDSDGVIIGKPFPIGETAEAIVPKGATAVSLGINDDRYADNTGGLDVTIHVPEPSVTVEGK